MKNFLKTMLAVVCGLLIVGVIKWFIFLGLIGSWSASGEAITSAKPHSVYEIRLKGTLVERTDEDAFTSAIMEAMGEDSYIEYGLNDVLSNIRKAKNDPNIDGIYLHGGSMQMGYASAQAVRKALQDFRSSGKFVVAYADTYGQCNYYLASCADHLFVNADGALTWGGMDASVMFYTRLLEKLGVEMQVVKVGTFKSAVEPFMLTQMSDANKLQYTTLLNDMWEVVCSEVAESRAISVDSLNMLADMSMMLQPQSLYTASHMVDALCYEQDIDSVLMALTGSEDYELLSHSAMNTIAERSNYDKNKIAILYAEGDITDETGDGIVGKEMLETIDELMEKDNVKAVVLRINSGGGSAYASEQINHALQLLKAEKPVVVSMGDYAASGGYYIAAPANYIFAEPTTLTGSIGIFGLIPSVHGLADKIGVDIDGVQTHQHSNIETNMVYKGMNAEERAMMQAEINRGYDLFTHRCAEGRGLTQDSIKAIGEGRVWSGTRALAIGLVDELGTLQDAVDKAAELAELDSYMLVEYPEPEDMLTTLLEAFSSSARVETMLRNRVGKDTYETLRYVEQLKAEPSIQARLPYMVEIK